MNPAKYASTNEVQKRNTLIAINVTGNDLKNISGICMDIGCGSGDITNDILLPALHPNAIVIAFENIYRMLQPGGFMLVIFPAFHNTTFDVFKIMAKNIRFAPYMQNAMNFISPFRNIVLPIEKLKDIIQSIGFRIYHCSLQDMDIADIDIDTFLTSVLSISSFLDVMPPNLREEFKTDYIREYKQYKTNLHINEQYDNEKDSSIDLHKFLLAYAQKDI
ncbi:hypothetical protein P5V15_012168 [Pogonomyrmex californicus]